MSYSRNKMISKGNDHARSHLVIVEAYQGIGEFITDEQEERESSQSLGLPVADIAKHLDCDITVLTWDKWCHYERQSLKIPSPATQPVESPDFNQQSQDYISKRVRRVPIPPIDPDYKLNFEQSGLSPRSHGLIHDGGLLSFISYCLHRELTRFYESSRFQAVIVPMLGGLGYVVQMARATHAPNQLNVPFGVVVSDVSLNRQRGNQEGFWTRHNIIRRQMEDISLALADLVLTFGPRGKDLAIAGRLPEANLPVISPRFVDPFLLKSIAEVSEQPPRTWDSLQFFLYEPQQAASGVLTTLDAVRQVTEQGERLANPFISAGPPMIFAPMRPREFVDYWSSRGFVRELIRDRQWQWQRTYPVIDRSFPMRLYPSGFDSLPNIWAELARGSLVLLSPAAAEGLAPGEVLPPEVLLEGEPTVERVAKHLVKLTKIDLEKLDLLRRELCRQVVRAHQGQARKDLLEKTTAALNELLHKPPERQDLSRVALLFSDRRLPLQVIAQQTQSFVVLTPHPQQNFGKLSVVVTCYEIGSILKESLTSVWNSVRCPDEVILMNDGSQGEETLQAISELEHEATEQKLPLRVIHQGNCGLAAARNKGLELAQGEFISFVDGDDLIANSYYDVAVQLLNQYPTLGGVAAWAEIFGTDVQPGFWNAPQTEFPFLFAENSVIVPCVTRTALLRQLGGYDLRQRYNYEDWELSIRMLGSGWPIVTIPMHLMKYRIRRDSLYRSMTDLQNQVMREQLMMANQEIVAKFSVEISMQLEYLWKRIAFSDAWLNLSDAQQSPNPSLTYFSLRKELLQYGYRFFQGLLKL